MRHYFAKTVYVDSVGLRTEAVNPFAVAVMDEIGLNISEHKPKTFDELEDGYFDLVVSLSPEAHHRALELTRTAAIDVEYWPIFDPTAVQGSRESRVAAFRETRDTLDRRLKERFGLTPAAGPE